ncbi:MAG: hypothetical protein JWQ49_2223 [Edaphobacter sp.]|nr:hypothetical protein [Edaphobacter sp.]
MIGTIKTRCLGKLVGLGGITGCLLFGLPQTTSAQTCLQEEYNKVQKQKLNCTANDVRIAAVTNIRDPLTGATLTSCIAGQTFNFLADFEIVTSSSQARENIGLYIATNSTTQALTGSCVDNIVQPKHPCPSNSSISCGSDNYHSTDPAPDNCGDTSSNDSSPTFGAGAEKVTLEIDNFLCEAPAGQNNAVLPNCTSWQIPGGTIQCVSPAPDFPYPLNGPGGTPTAIPGSPSKCNCSVIQLPISIQSPSINVAKGCNTATTNSPNPPDFTNLSMPNPSSCTLSPEGGQVTYTVDMVNDKSNFGSVVIDQICDSAYGTVFQAGSFTGQGCAAGSVTGGTILSTTCNSLSSIAFGASETCTFIVNQAEHTTVDNTATVSGHGSTAGKFGPTSSNQVEVVSNEAPTTGTIVKTFGGNTSGCATVRYNVQVKNTSAAGTDETLSLSALNDSAFGNITSLQGSVLGTTCGVAVGQPGLGSLSGVNASSTNGGILPASISPNNGAYSCQFDGNFCSALDSSGCFTHSNTVSATLTGDESEVVSLTPGTLNLKECLIGTPQ